MSTRAWIVGLGALLSSATAGLAQIPDSARMRDTTQRRALVESQLRARLSQIVQTRLGLSADQARRLAETDRRFESQRQDMALRERRVRQEMRRAMQGGESDERAVGALIDQMIQLQRDRVELLAREQRDLAQFLTPVQRARYIALQNDLRRRVEMMQRQREQRPLRRPGGGGGMRPRRGRSIP